VIALNLLDFIGLAPALPGAKCRGRHSTFDEAAPDEAPETVAQRHAQALSSCSRCPSLERCRDWINSVKPSKRPEGVCAGQVWENGRPKSGRPRTAVKPTPPTNHHRKETSNDR
jgi:WhiB family redox-sensing transcriptional regulator